MPLAFLDLALPQYGSGFTKDFRVVGPVLTPISTSIDIVRFRCFAIDDHNGDVTQVDIAYGTN